MGLHTLHSRRRAAVAALAIYAALCVIFLVSDAHRLTVIDNIADAIQDPATIRFDGASLLTSARGSDNVTHTLRWLSLVALIICAATFLRWFRQAYRNVLVFGFRPRHSLEWSTGSWFVPFVSFGVPKQTVNDIWRGSAPGRDPNLGLGSEPVASVLNVWWAVWVIGGLLIAVVQLVTNSAATSAHSVSSLRTGTYVHMAFDVSNTIAALLAIAVMAEITSRQDERVSTESILPLLTGQTVVPGAGWPPSPPMTPQTPRTPPPTPPNEDGPPAPDPKPEPRKAPQDFSQSVPPPGFGR